MQRPTDLNVGHMFRVIRGNRTGEIISLKQDDGTENPFFWNEDWSEYHCMYFSNLEPYLKTIRDAQVGDVVVGNSSGFEYLVLERGKNTVLLSSADNFKRAQSDYTFDQLEEGYTLKDAPVVADNVVLTMNEIAEKFGIDVSTLKIAKE